MVFILIDIVRVLGTIYSVLLIARVLLSWVKPDPHSPLVRWLHRLTDPVLVPISQILPTIGGIDFSPMAALFLLNALQKLIIRLLSAA